MPYLTFVELKGPFTVKNLVYAIEFGRVSNLFLLTLGVVGELSSGEVEGVDEEEGEGSGAPTRGDVLRELFDLAGVLGGLELSLDLVFEGKVKGLSGLPEF